MYCIWTSCIWKNHITCQCVFVFATFVKCLFVKLQIGAFHRSISSCQRQSRDVCRLVLHTLEQSGLDFSGFLGTQIADQSVLSLFRFLGIQQRKFTFSEVLKKKNPNQCNAKYMSVQDWHWSERDENWLNLLSWTPSFSESTHSILSNSEYIYNLNFIKA